MASQTFSIKLTANGKEVIALQDALKEKAKEYEQELGKINEQLKERDKLTKEEIKALEKEADSLANKIKALGTAVEENITNMRKIDDVLKNLAGSSTAELGKALRGVSQQFKRVSEQTLKQGETMEQKLTEIKEKMMEVRHEMTKRDGIDAMKRAKATLTELANTPLDKLKMGLESIEKRLSTMSEAELRAADGMTLLQGRSQYKAQIAVNEFGRAGTSSLNAMNNEQLTKERARLTSLYSATEGVSGFETISKDALDRLQRLNQLLKERADKEREAAKAAKETAAAQQQQQRINDIWNRWAQNQKVTLSEMIELQKHFQEQLRNANGIGIGQDEQDRVDSLRKNLNIIKGEIEQLTQDPKLDINKMLANIDNQPLEKLEAGLKQLQEESKKLTVNSPWTADQLGQQMDAFQKKIDQIKHSMEQVKQLDIEDMLEDWNIDDQPLEKIEEALKQLEAEEKKLTANMTGDAERIRTQREKLLAQQKKIKQATIDYASAEKMAGETGKHSVVELQKSYDTLKQKLMGLSTGQKAEIEQTRENMAKLKKAIDETTGSISKQGGIWQTAVKNITAYVGVFGAFNFIKGKLTDVVRLNLELSDSMANIRKVSGLAMRDIQDLTRTLAKMDTRTTLSELEEISYRGAKLGFGNFGTQGLLEFAQAANVVNVALKEDLGDEALAALSKITENMGLIKKMGVEDAMLATGSAMFQLAASSTAAAGPIVEVTKRLVPVAQMSGFATHEILALASASDSLHLMPEVVGTALSKLIMALQNNHNLVEKYLGIDEGTIARLFKAGDAMDALLLVFDKMNGKNVTELDDLWKLLGSDGQRLITVVADMANHTDTLRTHLETSTKAFKEATAVTDEYNIQQETAAALIERANNAWRNAFVNPDAEQNVKGLAKAWYDFSKGLLESQLTMSGVTLALNLLLGSLRLLLSMLPALSVFAIVKMFNKLRVAMLESKIATDMFATSWKNMTTATKANWIGLILASITQLVFWIKNAASESDDLATSQKKLQDAMSSAQGKAEEEIGSLARLKGQLENATLAAEDRAKILNKVKSDYDHYLNYLGVEIETVDDLTKHYDALTKVMKQRFAYQEREDYKRENLQDIKQERRNAGADLKRMGKDIGLNIDLSLVDQYVKSGAKTAGEVFVKMFPDVEKTIAARQKTGMGGGQYGDFSKQFAAYFGKVKTEVEQTKKIDDAFAEEIGDFDYDKYLRTQIKGDFKVKPDKEELKEQRKAAQDRKRELKQELELAKRDSDAVIAKIEEWYRLQEAAITAQFADGILSEKESKTIIRELNIYKNQALGYARQAITGRDTESWNEFKENMGAMMMDTGEWSKDLLSEVQQVNIDAVRAAINRFNGSDEVMGISAASVRDAINKNAAGNQRTMQRLRAEANQEIEDLLRKYHFFEQARDKFYDDLMSIGAIGETAEEMADRIQQGGQRDYRKEVMPMVEALGTRFRALGTRPFQIDRDNAQEIADLIGQMIQDHLQNPDEPAWTLQFPNLLDWQQDAETYKTELKNFYDVLLKMESDYYKARKQQREQDRKDAQERWMSMGWDVSEEQTDMQLQSQQSQRKIAGIGESFGQQYGWANTIAEDPEIKRIQNRIYWRNMELENLKATNASQELIMEKQNELLQAGADLAEKVSAEIANRVQKVQELSQPIADFAENAGQKLGDMMFNMQSQSMTWEQMWKNMVLALAQSTVKMGAQWLTQKIQQALFYKQMEADEATHQAIMTMIAIGGATARMEGEAAINATGLATNAAINTAEVGQEVSMATILTMLGISKGAAKIIGTLGWWGIPLIAVISSLLLGLLASALSTAGQESGGASAAAKPKIKLASGMLTYDEGNVQTVVGDDGRVYRAREQRSLPEGVSMVTEPIATRVNGQQALVGERGPEIVIGRRTTRAIQMNRPDLLRDLAMIDRGITTRKVRTFDEGNISDMATAFAGQLPAPQQGQQGSEDSPEMRQTLDSLSQTVAALSATVLQLQKNGIPSYIKKYGTGGLIDEVQSGLKFVGKYK